MHHYHPEGDSPPPAGGCEMLPIPGSSAHYCLTHGAIHVSAASVCAGRGHEDLLHLFREAICVWLLLKEHRPDLPVIHVVLDVE
jgi:hypothetical protein